MTLEQRIEQLEKEVAELKRQVQPNINEVSKELYRLQQSSGRIVADNITGVLAGGIIADTITGVLMPRNTELTCHNQGNHIDQ